MSMKIFDKVFNGIIGNTRPETEESTETRKPVEQHEKEDEADSTPDYIKYFENLPEERVKEREEFISAFNEVVDSFEPADCVCSSPYESTDIGKSIARTAIEEGKKVDYLQNGDLKDEYPLEAIRDHSQTSFLEKTIASTVLDFEYGPPRGVVEVLADGVDGPVGPVLAQTVLDVTDDERRSISFNHNIEVTLETIAKNSDTDRVEKEIAREALEDFKYIQKPGEHMADRPYPPDEITHEIVDNGIAALEKIASQEY
jgi:hypothetical protein